MTTRSARSNPSTARRRRPLQHIAKRALDVFLSGAALVLTAPIQLVLAVLIKVDSRGPVLYRGVRVGRGGKPFRMLKFRTMVVDADRIGGPSTAGDDPRITRMGHLLRRYKLDELPQLLNVFKGEMSLVGPRPEVPHYVEMYEESELRLLEVKPGITDYASLKFHNEGEILRGAEDPEEAYMRLIRPEKIRLGLEYVDNWSIAGDLKILGLTLRQILSRGDSSSGNEAEVAPDYSTVTETSATPISKEAVAMMEARYAWAAERARGKRVLELGCGSGQGLGLLQESAAAVVGGDPMHKLLAGAKNHYGDRVVLVALDAHRLPFRADSFDVIVMFEMIYYLQDPAAVLHECRRVLSADAVILIATANPERPDFNPSPYSHRYFSAAELVKLFAEAGFACELFAGFPAADPGFKSKVLALARRVAVRLHLIPKTMAGKAWLKRLVYGELQTVAEVSGDGTPPRLEPLEMTQAPGYKVIYAAARPT